MRISKLGALKAIDPKKYRSTVVAAIKEGTRTEAAAKLGISVSSLNQHLKCLGLVKKYAPRKKVVRSRVKSKRAKKAKKASK